jgi:hypothetical protein
MITDTAKLPETNYHRYCVDSMDEMLEGVLNGLSCR